MAKVNAGSSRTRVKAAIQTRAGSAKPVNKTKASPPVKSRDKHMAKASTSRTTTRTSPRPSSRASRGAADQELKVGRGRPKKEAPVTRAPKAKPAAARGSGRARVPRGNVGVDQLLYKVEVVGRAPILVSGMLVSYNEKTLVMRHKRERSSKIMVESFAMRDVVFINGHEGEQATVCVYVVATIRSFEGQLKSLVGADYIEVILSNGEQVVLNRNSSSGLEIKITAIEDDVGPEIQRKVNFTGSSDTSDGTEEHQGAPDEIDEDEQFEDDDDGLDPDPVDDAESLDEIDDGDDGDGYDE